MGSQTVMAVLLSLLVVGVGIAVGISKFVSESQQANKDGLTLSLMRISADAYQFKTRSLSVNGGNGSYDRSGGGRDSYEIPQGMQTDNFGTYSLLALQADRCALRGVSADDTGRYVICLVDKNGKTKLQYVGW